MYYEWSEQAVRWFYAASAYTGFHRELARLFHPHLTRGGTLADFGCGLGLLDLELAGDMARVTCVDRAALPLEELAREAQRRGVGNLETVQADSRTLTGQWDHVISCFYGQGEELIDLFLPRCWHSVVAAVRADGERAFSPNAAVCHVALERTEQALERRGAVYRKEKVSLEYGQPLESREDAARFVRSRCEGGAVEEYLDAHLVPLDHPRWPWYLPNKKEFTLFVLLRGENEHLLSPKGESIDVS